MIPPSTIQKAAEALLPGRVYEGYDAETKARLMDRERSGAERDARTVLEAIGLAELLEAAEPFLTDPDIKAALCRAGKVAVHRRLSTAIAKIGAG